MTELPTGTVTFLFAAVEGSTKLLHELGAEAYAAAVAERLEPGPIRLRIGLYTGTPLVTDEGYVGPDVHRAARMSAAASGSQIVVSAATRALIAEDDFVDLGPHRFKDLAAAEHVYQLGSGEFPPIKSLPETNLPVPATPFLGRSEELASVSAQLSSEGVRLLTLTGAGGTGKTRLALQSAAEVAEAFPGGGSTISRSRSSSRRRERSSFRRGSSSTGWASASISSRAGATPIRVSRRFGRRSEEHTSELQSRGHLVCRLLLEKKKKIYLLCFSSKENTNHVV